MSAEGTWNWRMVDYAALPYIPKKYVVYVTDVSFLWQITSYSVHVRTAQTPQGGLSKSHEQRSPATVLWP